MMQDRPMEKTRFPVSLGRLGRPLPMIMLASILTLSACQEQKAVTEANVTLEFSNFEFEYISGRNRFTHTRTFNESNGMNAEIIRGRVCVQSGDECVDTLLDYKVPASGQFIQNNHHFATPLDKDRATFEYWLRDEAGNEFKIERTITIDSGVATVLPVTQ